MPCASSGATSVTPGGGGASRRPSRRSAPRSAARPSSRLKRANPASRSGYTPRSFLCWAWRTGWAISPRRRTIPWACGSKRKTCRSAFAWRAARNARKTSDGERGSCIRGSDGVPHLMGRLWARTRKNKESATFEYEKAWLENPARFSLEPALQVGPGPFHTTADTPMFGAIGDSAPDRGGPAPMRRMERRRAEREGGAPRTLQEIDFLLLVDDEARLGALRFAEKEGGPFLR